MNAPLKSMLDKLGIPVDQQKQLEVNKITDWHSLKAKRCELESQKLADVDPAVQKVVCVALVYLLSLEYSGDPLPTFDTVGWMDFCEKHRGRNLESHETIEVSDDGMDIDKEVDDDDDDDDDVMGRPPIARQKIKAAETKDSAVPQDRLQKLEEDEELDKNSKFELTDQGFDPSEGVLPSFDNDEDANTIKRLKGSLLTFADFAGRRFYKRHCYYIKSGQDGFSIVGIKAFKSETEAICVGVVSVYETFLGKGEDTEDFEKVMEEHNPSFYVQLREQEVLHLSELEQPCSYPKPEYLPDMIYERQGKKGRSDRQSFGYVYDNYNQSNLVQISRKKFGKEKGIRLLEGFAGAGGMHLGFEQEGFTTVKAVELNDAAVNTFQHNNPDVPVFHGDVNDFTRNMKEDPEFRKNVGRVDAIHVSSPCQGFSGANRNGGQNDHINNALSYTFVDWLKVTKALVGTFENVEGMWRKKGMPYLRKLLIGTMAEGYQVRLMVLRACHYGDPQERPRLIIFAAKKFVRMPVRPLRTHGPGEKLLPYVTTKRALDYLQSRAAQDFPNMKDLKTTTKKPGDVDTEYLVANGLAPTVLASGPAIFHYEAKDSKGQPRCINVREAAALQSFPFDYEFLGSIGAKYKQAGNAVPVNFAAAIARSVHASLCFMYQEELGTNQGANTAVQDGTTTGVAVNDVTYNPNGSHAKGTTITYANIGAEEEMEETDAQEPMAKMIIHDFNHRMSSSESSTSLQSDSRDDVDVSNIVVL